MSTNPYHLRQIKRNRETRDAWVPFSSHRNEVTQRIESAAFAPDSSLCLLGAGNSNDVDLVRLRGAFSRIELVDLDASALRDGLTRQGLQNAAGVTYRELDLAGGLAELDCDDQLIKILETVPHWTEERFEVVASVCVLSQLIESVAILRGAHSSDLADVVLRVRLQHLRCMASLLQPRASGILITDFVSSETCPELAQLDAATLPQAARAWIESRNFFTGTNPFAIRRQIQQEMSDQIDPSSIRVDRPWKWNLGPRVYAVAAIQFRRIAASDQSG